MILVSQAHRQPVLIVCGNLLSKSVAELESEFRAWKQQQKQQKEQHKQQQQQQQSSQETTSSDSELSSEIQSGEFREFVAQQTVARVPGLAFSNTRVFFSLIADSAEAGKSVSRGAFVKWLAQAPVVVHGDMCGALFDALVVCGSEAERDAGVLSFGVFSAFAKKCDEVLRRGAESPDWQVYIRQFSVRDDVALVFAAQRVVQQILPAHTSPEVIGSVFLTGEHLHFMPERTALVATCRRAWPIAAIKSTAVKSAGLLSTGCQLELQVEYEAALVTFTLTFQKIKEKEMKATLVLYLDELQQAWRLAADDEVDQAALAADGTLPRLVRFAAANVQRCVAIVEAQAGQASHGDLPRLLLCRDRKRRPLLRAIDERWQSARRSADWNDTRRWLWAQLSTSRRLIDVNHEHEITELNFTEFKNDVVQFKDLLGALFDWFDDADFVFAWKRPVVSFISFFVLMWLAVHDLQWAVVPIFMLWRAAKIVIIRVLQGAELEREFGSASVDQGADGHHAAADDDDSDDEHEAPLLSASQQGADGGGKRASSSATSGDAAKDAQHQQGRLERWRQMYAQLEEDLRVGKDKAIAAHRSIREKNTVMLKGQTINMVAVPHLSLTFAFAIGGIAGLMFVVPFRYFFMVIVLHLFTKDMYFRKDPSPIDRFYDAIPVRNKLEQYLDAHPEQKHVIEKRRKEKEAAEKAAAAAAAATPAH